MIRRFKEGDKVTILPDRRGKVEHSIGEWDVNDKFPGLQATIYDLNEVSYQIISNDGYKADILEKYLKPYGNSWKDMF